MIQRNLDGSGAKLFSFSFRFQSGPFAQFLSLTKLTLHLVASHALLWRCLHKSLHAIKTSVCPFVCCLDVHAGVRSKAANRFPLYLCFLSPQCHHLLSPCQSQYRCPIRALCHSAIPAASSPLPSSPPLSQTRACCRHSNRSSRGTRCLQSCHRDLPAQVKDQWCRLPVSKAGRRK